MTAKKAKQHFLNLIIIILATAAVYQTGILWLDKKPGKDIFYSIYKKFVDDENYEDYELSAISPKSYSVGYGNMTFSVISGRASSKNLEDSVNKVITAMFENGTYSSQEEINWNEYLEYKAVICKFPILVSANEYAKAFGSEAVSKVSNLGSFDSIAIIPEQSGIENSKIIFINENDNTAEIFTCDKNEYSDSMYSLIEYIKQSGSSLTYISTKQNQYNIFRENVFVPQWGGEGLEKSRIEAVSPFIFQDKVYYFSVESKVNSFFTSNTSKRISTDNEGTYTLSDETSVVKIYNSGMLEYYNYSISDNERKQTLATAYNAANSFLDRDLTLNTDIYLSDIQITGEGLVFNYDYVVDGLRVNFSDELKEKLEMTNAISIVVKDNSVKKYRRFAYNFQETDEKIIVDTDFITAMNNAVMEYSKEGSITKIDDTYLCYYVSDEKNIEIKWITVIDGLEFAE